MSAVGHFMRLTLPVFPQAEQCIVVQSAPSLPPPLNPSRELLSHISLYGWSFSERTWRPSWPHSQFSLVMVRIVMVPPSMRSWRVPCRLSCGASPSPARVPVDLPRRRQPAARNGCGLALWREAIKVGKLALRPRQAAADRAWLEDAQQRRHGHFGAEAFDQRSALELRKAMAVRAVHADHRIATVA